MFGCKQKGFTLVELAIVILVIGLLIGGVLRGQEIIENAKVTSFASKLRLYDQQANVFTDQYGSLPGDISGAAVRLPLCDGGCVTASGTNVLGNGIIENESSNFASLDGANVATDESALVFIHLAAAEMINDVAPNATGISDGSLPETGFNGGFLGMGHWNGRPPLGFLSPVGDWNRLSKGHYYITTRASNKIINITSGIFSPAEAQRIDSKLDDGFPADGRVLAIGQPACASQEGGSGDFFYDESVNTVNCGLVIPMSL